MQSTWESAQFSTLWRQIRHIGSSRNDAVVVPEAKAHTTTPIRLNENSLVQRKILTLGHTLILREINDVRKDHCFFSTSQPLKPKEIYIEKIDQDGFFYCLNYYPKYYPYINRAVRGKILFQQIEFTSPSDDAPTMKQLTPYLGKIIRIISEQGNYPYPVAQYDKLYQDNHGNWCILQKNRYCSWLGKENFIPVAPGTYAFVKFSSENYYRVWSMENKKSEHFKLADLSPWLEYAGELIFSQDDNKVILKNWNNQSSAYPGDEKLCHQAGLPTSCFYDYKEKNTHKTLETSHTTTLQLSSTCVI